MEGKRVKHFRPFAFVIIMSTIGTLINKVSYFLINQKFSVVNPGRYIKSSGLFFADYISLVVFILIPILSFFTWIFYRKRQYNYWEYFLINTYAAAYLNVFLSVIYIYRVIKYYAIEDTNVNFTAFMFLFMAYYGHVFGGLMRNEKWSLGKNIAYLALLNFFLATIYMTAFSLTKIMTPWWGK